MMMISTYVDIPIFSIQRVFDSRISTCELKRSKLISLYMLIVYICTDVYLDYDIRGHVNVNISYTFKITLYNCKRCSLEVNGIIIVE